LKEVCGLFGKTRQAWYVHQWSPSDDGIREAIVVKRVKEIRAQMPRLGGRKLQVVLKDTLADHGISIGRDRLYDLLEAYHLQLRRRKRRKAITTNSNHPFHKYPNLIRDMKVISVNQLWVSDITYIRLTNGFCYLSLITDAYSRKIVGYHLNEDLKKEGPLKALQMAIENKRPNGQKTTHHSDRGLQYCCEAYTSNLINNNISISMTERGDPYENAIAERVNGILKEEFMLDQTFRNHEHAQQAVVRAIFTYNTQRPHASCDYMTPEQAHQYSGTLRKRWKKQVFESTQIKVSDQQEPAGGSCLPTDTFCNNSNTDKQNEEKVSTVKQG
jgi:transposase InsO family protein